LVQISIPICTETNQVRNIGLSEIVVCVFVCVNQNTDSIAVICMCVWYVCIHVSSPSVTVQWEH